MTQPVITDAQFTAMEKRNAENLKKLKEGQSIEYKLTMQGRDAVLLIGDRHDAVVVRLVNGSKHMRGTITIKKGTMLNAGELTVTGNSGRRAEMQAALNAFSKKKVTWA